LSLKETRNKVIKALYSAAENCIAGPLLRIQLVITLKI
jgi:hypothetical protein